MKNIKYLLIAIILSLLLVSPKTEVVNKLEIDLKNDETSILFILNDIVNAIYIRDKGLYSLIVLDYKDDEKIIEKKLKDSGVNKVDKIYTVTPVILKLFKITSEYLRTRDNLIMFNYYDNNFCIYLEEYQGKPNLKMCKFLYTVKFKNSVLADFIGNPEIIFQNESNPLPVKTQELIYDSWTELYTVNDNEYIILKIAKESFDTLIISK